jgi:hypothetical protein
VPTRIAPPSTASSTSSQAISSWRPAAGLPTAGVALNASKGPRPPAQRLAGQDEDEAEAHQHLHRGIGQPMRRCSRLPAARKPPNRIATGMIASGWCRATKLTRMPV